jgi:hypothetical protein
VSSFNRHKFGRNVYSPQVDKIVIDNIGVRAFVNNLHPDTYQTVSSVDYAALDAQRLQLVGIYGSKDEIVRFLLSHGHIDGHV